MSRRFTPTLSGEIARLQTGAKAYTASYEQRRGDWAILLPRFVKLLRKCTPSPGRAPEIRTISPGRRTIVPFSEELQPRRTAVGD